MNVNVGFNEEVEANKLASREAQNSAQPVHCSDWRVDTRDARAASKSESGLSPSSDL